MLQFSNYFIESRHHSYHHFWQKSFITTSLHWRDLKSSKLQHGEHESKHNRALNHAHKLRSSSEESRMHRARPIKSINICIPRSISSESLFQCKKSARSNRYTCCGVIEKTSKTSACSPWREPPDGQMPPAESRVLYARIAGVRRSAGGSGVLILANTRATRS